MLLIAGVRHLRRRPEPIVIEHEHELVAAGARTGMRAHRHRHRHIGTMPDDPLPSYGGAVTFGVGMVHGIGFETPARALVFVTAAGDGSRAAGLLVLACFLVGPFALNTVVAAVSTFGFTGAGSRARLYTAASLVAAAGSLAVGLLYIAGMGDVLPG